MTHSRFHFALEFCIHSKRNGSVGSVAIICLERIANSFQEHERYSTLVPFVRQTDISNAFVHEDVEEMTAKGNCNFRKRRMRRARLSKIKHKEKREQEMILETRRKKGRRKGKMRKRKRFITSQ